MNARSPENISRDAQIAYTDTIDPHSVNASELNPNGTYNEKRKFILHHLVKEGRQARTYNPHALGTFRGLWLKDGTFLTFTPRNLARAPKLIKSGAVDPLQVLRLGYARTVHENDWNVFQKYSDIFQAAEEATKNTTHKDTPPPSTDSLEKRLIWTIQDPPEREELARKKRQETTDSIRSILIPRYHEHGLDFLTQVRLIHRAHMKGNEHLILQSNQAKRLLRNDIYDLDRLGGKIRNKNSMPIDVSMGNGSTLCVSYEETPDLITKLAQKAEILFPLEERNDTVNHDTIYHFVSAVQLYMALIHPFYEGNGRTSEDLMYILWKRRPDLINTVRYISSDGIREEKHVDERMEIIDTTAKTIQRNIGIALKASPEEFTEDGTTENVLKAFKKWQTNPAFSADIKYRVIFEILLESFIDKMTDFDELRKDPTIDLLAENLRSASLIYTLKNGTVLGDNAKPYR